MRRRSCLTVPGGSPKTIAKAASLPADEIVLDLEDAVPPAGKDEARRLVLAALGGADLAGRRIAVRINARGTPWHADDLAALAQIERPDFSLVVPKVDTPAALQAVDAALGARHPAALQGLIETAAGLAHCVAIAAATPRLEALILGYADLASSLGRDAAAGWSFAQDMLVLAARAGGVDAIDGPAFDLAQSTDTLAEECRRAAAMGFDGKWAIHPRQIEAINAAFTPSAAAVAKARGVLAALAAADGETAIAVHDGGMIDEAMRRGAERTLLRAGMVP
jgi:citrate lyase subunit beta/citryl-CoA lyase